MLNQTNVDTGFWAPPKLYGGFKYRMKRLELQKYPHQFKKK